MEGKVRAATRLITQTGSTGPLLLDSLANDKDPTSTKTVREVLVEKHPSKQPPNKASIANPDNPVDNPHPIIFYEINGTLIRNIILRMDGAAGPAVWS